MKQTQRKATNPRQHICFPHSANFLEVIIFRPPIERDLVYDFLDIDESNALECLLQQLARRGRAMTPLSGQGYISGPLRKRAFRVHGVVIASYEEVVFLGFQIPSRF